MSPESIVRTGFSEASRENHQARARASERQDGTDHVSWRFGWHAVHVDPRIEARHHEADAAREQEGNAGHAESRRPHPVMQPEGEGRAQGRGDKEVQVLHPALRPGRERTDRHRDLAVIGLQDFLNDDQRDEGYGADDPGERELCDGKPCGH